MNNQYCHNCKYSTKYRFLLLRCEKLIEDGDDGFVKSKWLCQYVPSKWENKQ
jgi:hypothetical protein